MYRNESRISSEVELVQDFLRVGRFPPVFILSLFHTPISFIDPPHSGPDTSVGTATDYGLDGPGSNPGWEEIFRPSRPVLGHAQPPVKLVEYRVFPGG